MSRQKLGQHFLASGKALQRIVAAATGGTKNLAVEIGPGKGALTQHLLVAFEKVVAIELDPVLAAFLRLSAAAPPDMAPPLLTQLTSEPREGR